MMREEALIRQMYTDGQRAWPSVQIDIATFRDHCERVVDSRLPSEEASRHAPDLYLCAACAAQNEQAIRAVERGALATVAAPAIARIHGNPEFVGETLQEFSVRLLVGPQAKILEYGGRGPLEAWLRVAATRLALDRLRQQRASVARQFVSSSPTTESASPEANLTRARFGEQFQRALIQSMGNLSAQERNVLRMHVVGGCSVDQIGRAYNVHRATAARWLDRAKTRVFEAVREEFVGRDLMTDSEFRSVAGALWYELKLGFSADNDGRRDVGESGSLDSADV